MIKIKETEPKTTARKKTITLEDVLTSELKFVDTDGADLTDDFKNALPKGMETVVLKVTFELPDEETEETATIGEDGQLVYDED